MVLDNMAGLLISWAGFTIAVHLTTAVQVSYDEINKLKKTLFENYNPSTRPVVHQNDTVYVNLSLTMTLLDSLDIKRQTLTSAGFLTAKWYDELLTWNKSEYGGLDNIFVRQSNIWTPDYVVNHDVTRREHLWNYDTLVHISSNGLVVWEPAFASETSCKVDIKKYPFDEQDCFLQVISWMTTSRQLTTNIDNEMLQFQAFHPHGEFIITAKDAQLVNYTTGFTDDVLLAANFYIHLKRQHSFYWMSIVLPMVTFPILCPISFLVPVEGGEKITLAITVVLSYLVFIASLNEQMPRLSDTVSLLVLYSTIQITISILTVVANGVVIYLYNIKPTNNLQHVDRKSGHAIKNHQSNSVYPLKIVHSIFKNQIDKHRDSHTSVKNSLTDIRSGDNSQVPKEPNWKVIARRLDKICFFFFMSVTLIVTLTFGLMFFVY